MDPEHRWYGPGVAAAVLGVHAVYALRHGFLLLRLPLEAGGLFLGLLVGLPLVGVGVGLAAVGAGVVAAPQYTWPAAVFALGCIVVFGAVLTGMGGISGWLVLSAASAALALAALVTAVLRSSRHRVRR